MNAQFDKIPVNEDILRFEEGLYGFEDIKEYALFTEDDASGIFYLQAVHTSVPSFVLIDPYAICQSYAPLISEDDLAVLDAKTMEDLRFLVIAAVKENYKDTVVNLKCPIAINPVTRLSKQLILENTDYSIRHRIFTDGGAQSC